MLIIGGIVLGLILSTIFITEANDRIQHFNDEFGDFIPPDIPDFPFRVTPLRLPKCFFQHLG